MTDAQALRHQLRAAGYCPIPLYGKAPPQYGKNNQRKGLQRWQTLHEVTAEQIDMWSKTWPDAINTGVLCRNMPTLDLDLLHEEAARACEDRVREHFEERGYILPRIGKPPKRAIPFRTEEPFKKIVVNLIAPNGGSEQKIEFLADGEQVVVAGIHPETKEPYRWHGGEPGPIAREDLPYIREAEARALVEDLVEFLVREFGYTRAPARKANGTKPVPRDGGGGGDSGWAYLCANIHAGRELHDSLRDLAAMLIACGTNSGATINLLRALMEDSDVPKDDRHHARVLEIPAAVDSAVAKYAPARSSPEPEADPLPPLPPPAAKPKRHPRFPLDTLEDITLPMTPNYLVKGILPRVGLGVAWGPPKCGKSFWTFDLVMHIACGRNYRGRPVRKGTVVYLALEGAFGFAGRVEAWRRHHKPPKDVPFYLLDVSINLIADHKALIDAIRVQIAGAPAIVVVDTLNRALLGDENDSKDMANFIRSVDAIRTAFGCLVLLIHHCGVVGTRPRGHTSLAGADDVQIQIAKDKEGIVVATIEHMKDGPSGAMLASKLEQINLGNDIDGDPITSCIIVPTEGGTAVLKLTKVQRFAYDLLRKLITSEGITPPAEANLPEGVKVCLSDTWRKRFYEEYPADKQDTKKKALLRATLDLEEAKVIVLWRNYVWVRWSGTF